VNWQATITFPEVKEGDPQLLKCRIPLPDNSNQIDQEQDQQETAVAVTQVERKLVTAAASAYVNNLWIMLMIS